ncbi:MAG: 16S rRNA (guanine(966)-N(2))-methyltransferase RsmD [Eubacteriales bacterium]|nr:16S rRNA (guanine(966)-N(2))-methyltransferase RsmD [Eubacteriales bacterium]
MRVISGEKRGTKLLALEGEDTRPTTDRVKESLFNIIQWDIPSKKVLDLFAGSGGLGLEALSRGAIYACFNDRNPSAVNIINSNVDKLGYADKCKVCCTDYLKLLDGTSKYDIIFLDPPYVLDYIDKSLEAISKNKVLNSDGLIVCETLKDKKINTSNFLVRKEVCYGITKLMFLEVRSDE